MHSTWPHGSSMGGLSAVLWSRDTGHAKMEWNANSLPNAISTGSCLHDAQSSPWLLPAITVAIFSSVGSASPPAC